MKWKDLGKFDLFSWMLGFLLGIMGTNLIWLLA